MSGEKLTTENVFIPAPTGGLNLIAPPHALAATEARELQNYLCFDWGIRERKAATVLHSHGGFLYSFYDNSSTQKILIFGSSTKVYRMASYSDTSPTDITGAVTITAIPSVNTNVCHFNKTIFFFDESDAPWQYSIAGGGNCTASSFTGPTMTQIACGWNYKNRLYLLEGSSGNPTQAWYGEPGAITGPFTSIDWAQVLDRPAPLLTGCSWGYNQGLQSEELFVLIGASGEVLFYSGDWPDADNWQLIARAKIPKPVGRDCVRKLGQELLVATVRGVIPMSKVFAGRSEDAEYFAITRNIGVYGYFASHQFTISGETPFLFGTNGPLAGSSGGSWNPVIPEPDYSVYVQNYETGAWSSLKFTGTVGPMTTANGYLLVSTSAGVVSVNMNNEVGAGENTAAARTATSWKTGFFDLGKNQTTKVNHLRVVGRDINTSKNQLINTAFTTVDYVDDGTSPSSSTDSNTLAVSAGVSAMQQLQPPGMGKAISFCFRKVPAAECNELYGFYANVTIGGVN